MILDGLRFLMIVPTTWVYKNSAPIFAPRRHLRRARRPELAFRDINKVNMPGTASAAEIVI
jgi:hypothetical protein